MYGVSIAESFWTQVLNTIGAQSISEYIAILNFPKKYWGYAPDPNLVSMLSTF